MSTRTDEALVKLDQLSPVIDALPQTPEQATLVDDMQALRRAVAAFHMEAIRFRMFNVDRGLKKAGDPADTRRMYEELRQALEAIGFHTRSHTAP